MKYVVLHNRVHEVEERASVTQCGLKNKTNKRRDTAPPGIAMCLACGTQILDLAVGDVLIKNNIQYIITDVDEDFAYIRRKG